MPLGVKARQYAVCRISVGGTQALLAERRRITHFGAARYQARRLGIAVPLTGTLCRYSVNVQMISVLRNKWHLLVIPKDELFGIFFDAMEAFECAFGCSDLPPRIHDENKSGVALKLIWLDRGNPRANAVAAVLARAGFPDFAKQLTRLAKKTSV